MEQNSTDIAPELLAKIRRDFEDKIVKSDKLSAIYDKINGGSATYLDANEFALGAGNILADVFHENISADQLPDGRMYYNIADRVIRPMMERDHQLISQVCLQTQGRLNQKAGIGIKPVAPELNDDKIRGIVNKVSEAEHFDDVSWVLGEPMRTFSQSIVDDSIKANVQFQGKSGLYPRIERIAASGCCKWCEEVSGTYRYPKVPKDVYRRHGHCRCMVDYDPADGKGKRQNVYDKSWQSQEEYDEKVRNLKTIGLNAGDNSAKIDYRKQIGLSEEKLSGREREVRTEWKLSAQKTSEGETASSRQDLGYIDTENVERTIGYFADQIRNETVEHAIIIQNDGKVIHFTGDESGVRVIDAELNGARILHNHPSTNGIVSFGEDDFKMIRDNQTAIYDLCNEKYDYHLEVVRDMSDLSYNMAYCWPSIEDAITGEDYQHLVMEELQERGYVKYERIKRG